MSRTRKSKRKAMSATEKLAAVLLLLKRGEGTPLIPAELRDKDARTIVRWPQWDHRVPVGLGGINNPQNIQPLPRDVHAKKTKRDVANISRLKRIGQRREERESVAQSIAVGDPIVVRPRKPKRIMPGSRASGWKQKVGGKWERRQRA